MYMKMKDRIIENLTVFQKGQSGWRFRSIVSLNVFTAEYKPLKGSSYIPLPSCCYDLGEIWVYCVIGLIALLNNDIILNFS